MTVKFIEHFIDNQIRIVGRSTERITLFDTFLAWHPVIFQPVEIAVGDLHNIPVHDRLVIITGSR
mgnify:CR=1 FL=1